MLAKRKHVGNYVNIGKKHEKIFRIGNLDLNGDQIAWDQIVWGPNGNDQLTWNRHSDIIYYRNKRNI